MCEADCCLLQSILYDGHMHHLHTHTDTRCGLTSRRWYGFEISFLRNDAKFGAMSRKKRLKVNGSG